MISKEHLIELTKITEPICVSIFVKTHRAGIESLQKEDSRRFSNQLEQAKNRLVELGWTMQSSANHLKPAYELLEDSGFWRELSDGLAVFITPEIFEKHIVPVPFENETYVSTELLIKPLLPLFQGNGNFFILSLSKENIQFYSAERHSITKLEFSAKSPEQLEDIVGYDFKEKSLQGRSIGKNSAMFHGHADNKRSDKEELKMFFRSIDEEVTYYSNQYPGAPVLIAGLDENFAIFKEINSSNCLIESNLSINPDSIDVFMLHEMAWEKMTNHFNEPLVKSINQYNNLLGSDLTSNSIKDIIQYALHGRIEALFIERQFDEYGTFNPITDVLNLGDKSDLKNVSLCNLIIRETLQKQGDVFVLNKDEMPQQNDGICCTLRY